MSKRHHERCGCAALRESSHGASARPFTFAGSPRHFERDRPFRVTHTALELDLDLAKKSVRGVASLSFERVDAAATELALDAIAFAVASVKLGAKACSYRYDGHTLTVDVGRTVSKGVIEIRYAATPRRGMYFLEPDEHYPARPRQVWTQCQEEDARHFFPCHDKPHMKMTFEVVAKVPEGMRVLSNGALVSEKTPKGAPWTFHWKMSDPLPSYLVTLVAGEFAVHEEKAGKLPISYWVPTAEAEATQRTFGRTPAMIRHFGELLGTAYPWNKYAQVVVSDFIFGGMENTTATTMYEHIMLDARAAVDVTSDDLIAHELAHHWFGDHVTCREWYEGWLNEGFATYMEHAWREEHLGHDEYEYGLKADLDGYVGEAHGRYRRAIVCQDYDSPLDLFDRHLYEKGALVLHTLRVTLGTDVFYKGVAHYLKRHGGGSVETRDLVRALEDVSGKSLGRLFDQSVYKPGHVELEVVVSWEAGVLSAVARQVHQATDGVPQTFEVPLELLVVGARSDSHKHVLRSSQRSETFAVPCPDRPAFVVIDPDMRILGEVTAKAPTDMLRAQLEKGATARARWLAALALSKSDDPVSIAALVSRMNDAREFWGVRVEAAGALGKLRRQECFDALSAALTTKHPKVRRAIVEALGAFRTPQSALALKPVALADSSYLVQAEAARALGKTRQATALDTLVELMSRKSWAEVVRIGALEGLAASRDERATPHVIAGTKYGHATRARRAAIMAIPKLSQDRRARELLEELLDDADPYLRIDVARALLELGDPRARGALRARLDVDLDPRVRRRLREVLRDLGEGSKRATDALRDELDKLQADHESLKARLTKLEAKPVAAKPRNAR
jgi:aminopeptidase N